MKHRAKQRVSYHAQRRAANIRKEKARYVDGFGYTRVAGYIPTTL